MTAKKIINGMTECRFEPLTQGHVYMVDVSTETLRERAYEENADYMMHVIVCSHDEEIIDGHTRYEWAQKTFGGDPHITVHHAHNSLEALGHEADYNGDTYSKDWNFWGDVATKMCKLGDSIDYVFGSESYVEGIARACNAEPIEIDEDRDALPISGTIMRNNPYLNWENFPDAVKPFFAKKICLTGAPYTGKAKLAKSLATHYNTVMVGKVSKRVYNHHEINCTKGDLEKIATMHTIQANALVKQANKVVISDSDTLLSHLWYQSIFNENSERLEELANVKRFDLYILCGTENWDFTPSENFPTEESWHEFNSVIKKALDERGWPYIELKHSLPSKRFTDSVVSIDELVWKKTGTDKMTWVPGQDSTSKYIIKGEEQ